MKHPEPRSLCSVATHGAVVGFTILITVLSRPGTSWFSLHPFLMTLAFSLFMTEALLLFSPHGWRLPHRTKVRVHWVLQVLCVASAVLGLAAISYNKRLSGKAHFTSWHGALGLLTVAAVGLQGLAGAPLVLAPSGRWRSWAWSPAALKRNHAASGLLAYLLGAGSLLLGLRSAWFTSALGGGVRWYLAALCPALSALVVTRQVTAGYAARTRPHH